MKKQLLMLFLKYGLGLGLLAWVIHDYWHIPHETAPGQTEEIGLSVVFERPIQWHFLALASTIAFTSVLMTFVRWYLLVRAQGLPFTLPSALRLGMIGFYLNTFLPGAVGGDIIKAAFIAREQSRRTVAVATVIIDRVIGLCGLVWLAALIGGAFWVTGLVPDIARSDNLQASMQAVMLLEAVVAGAAGFALASLIFWLLLGCLSQNRSERLALWLGRVPKVGGPLGELWRAAWLYRCRGRSVGVALLMSMIGHLGFVLVFLFSSWTLNPVPDTPSVRAHFLAVPVGMTISAGIPTPGGVGGGEFVYGWLYQMLGFSFAAGVLGSLMQRCINWVLGLLGYLVYLRMKPGLASALAPPKATEENHVPAAVACDSPLA